MSVVPDHRPAARALPGHHFRMLAITRVTHGPLARGLVGRGSGIGEVKLRRGKYFYINLAFTLLVCAFLIVPIVFSVLAGITENFFQGIKSGLTLRWVAEVWRLYADTIFLSLLIAITCLLCNLLIGVPAAYVLARKPGRTARIIEETLVLPIAKSS